MTIGILSPTVVAAFVSTICTGPVRKSTMASGFDSFVKNSLLPVLLCQITDDFGGDLAVWRLRIEESYSLRLQFPVSESQLQIEQFRWRQRHRGCPLHLGRNDRHRDNRDLIAGH